MPQQFLQEASNTFIKGLITEAGELTFPKDASVDELNCDLERDGSRRRRLGIEYETNYEESTETTADSTIVSVNDWKNVGNEAGVEFVVVQNGDTLFFYQKSGSTFSTHRVDTTKTSGVEYSLDLNTYERSGSVGVDSAKIQCTSINGALVVASPEMETILIERDITTGAFTVTPIQFKVRDFEWQGDTSTYDVKSTSNPPGLGRRYDTLNSGWVGTKGSAALTAYAAAKSAYPPLTLPWYSGKDSSDNFSVTEWDKVFAGNTLIVNGHFLFDLFSQDRDAASGLTGVPSSVETARFKTVASYSGRVFYAGLENSPLNNGSNLYFSQLLVSNFDSIGKCYQTNDPTSEVLSDLLDTDGGVITIPEAYNIKKLHVFGASLYVFAENGVWSISGVDDVFRATEYSVSKISDVGLGYEGSFVSANGRPYWWSYLGIYTLTLNEQSIVAQSISISTIQSFWNNISASKKAQVISIYDSIENRVAWLYPNNEETVDTKYNNILFFDEALTAFFPWTIEDKAGSTPIVVGVSVYTGAGVGDVEFTVVDSSGNEVVDGSGNVTTVTRTGRSFSSSSIKYLVRTTNNKFTFAEFTDHEFLDWGSANFKSFAETSYNFMGDLTTFKNAPYLTSYLKTTETGWEPSGGGGYTPIRESSCKVSFYWDFKKSSSSTPQQAYRLKPNPVVNESDLAKFDYPFDVVTTRLKLRGRGRSMRIKFESEAGKDFHLLGFEVIGAKNPRF